MWKRLRPYSQDSEQSSSDTLSDLSLSMVGVMVIAFTGYILKFRSEEVAQATSPTPPAATSPNEQPQQNPSPTGLSQPFGLKGPMKNVVFCLDLSGSMVGQAGHNYSQAPAELERRFQDVKSRLKHMVRTLGFETFTVIGFGGAGGEKPRLHASTPQMSLATAEARELACQHIDVWQAIGGTPTLQALQAAYSMSNVDHVVLLTDGLPTIGGTQEDVLAFVTQNNGQRAIRGGRRGGKSRVVVDVIGIGDQSIRGTKTSMALLDFTRSVANATGGFFQAW